MPFNPGPLDAGTFFAELVATSGGGFVIQQALQKLFARMRKAAPGDRPLAHSSANVTILIL